MQNNCVGNFIAQKRKAAGLTQKQLAEKLNISFQAIPSGKKGWQCPAQMYLLN